MKNIYVLEHFDFTEQQMEKLKSLGNIKYFQKATEKQTEDAINNADAILLDWIDPTEIITKMKKGQFICLPYTGYAWIKTLKQAIENGVVISNTPNYSTNAVAEAHLSLMLAVSKQIPYFNNFTKNKKNVPFNRSIELSGKRVGIIGLGHIGKRLAELLQPFNVELYTYNKSNKNISGIKDVTLDELLKTCDYVCITCSLNTNTKNMINYEKLSLLKSNAIITQTTGGIIDLFALDKILSEGKLFGVGLDDVDQLEIPENLYKHENLICTYHRAYDTNESEKNRIDMCIDNIENFFKGTPINQIRL